MSIKVCDCEDNGLGNLGTPNCQNIAGITSNLFLVPTNDSLGQPNYIDLTTATLDDAYFTAALQNADASKRWQFVPKLENVTNERAESQTEELGSGRSIKIRKGVKSFSGDIYKQSYTFYGKLELAGCTDLSAFPIDLAGNLIGRESADGTKLYPVMIDKETYDPIYMEPTDSTAAKINLKFDWSDTERDACLKMIKANEMSVDIFTLRSVIDANLVVDTNTAPSTTAIGVEVSMDYGTALKNKEITGLVAADFLVTSGGVVKVPDTVTEDPTGTYVFDFTGDPLTAATDAIVTLVAGGKFEANEVLTIAIP